jgi:DNA-binding MarR family transcriptional regulator
MPPRVEKPAVAPTPEELAALVAEFGKGYSRWLQSELQRAGTTPARARLLLALQCQGPCRMSDLSVQLGVTPRNVTKLVDGLEREGLVMRQPHPNDRRAVLLQLTGAGVLMCKESCMANAEATASLYAELTAKDRTDFLRVLQNLIAALERRKE